MRIYTNSFFVFIGIIFSVVSCQLFTTESNQRSIAKVHDVFLYKNQLVDFNIPKGLSEKDSISILTAHIDNWAKRQLILHQAKLNLTEKEQQQFEKLVEDYRVDLYVDAYENAYVQKQLNTKITDKEVQEYYQKHKSSYLLKESLVKYRYIKVSNKYKDLSATRRIFIRFKKEDQLDLKKIQASFISKRIEGLDQWVNYESLIQEIPDLKKYDANKILVADKYIQFSDKKGTYLIQIQEVIKEGEQAPLIFVEELVKQVIINKRKIKLKKQLEQEIIKDAIQTKEYQSFK